jgi:hypothetical protein
MRSTVTDLAWSSAEGNVGRPAQQGQHTSPAADVGGSFGVVSDKVRQARSDYSCRRANHSVPYALSSPVQESPRKYHKARTFLCVPPSCSQAIEYAEVPGQGSFTAYEDGRVRAMFEDRTILHVNAAQTHCKVRAQTKCKVMACVECVGSAQSSYC